MHSPMHSLKLSGQSEFKGRNGYAKLHRIDAHVLSALCGDPAILYMDLFSKRGADSAPARLKLTAEDLTAFQAFVAGLSIEDTRTEREIEIGSIAYAEEVAAPHTVFTASTQFSPIPDDPDYCVRCDCHVDSHGNSGACSEAEARYKARS